jgi:hypothetical protein
LKANKVNLFVSSVLCVFWYHSPNVLDTLHICNISWLRVKLYGRYKKTKTATLVAARCKYLRSKLHFINFSLRTYIPLLAANYFALCSLVLRPCCVQNVIQLKNGKFWIEIQIFLRRLMLIVLAVSCRQNSQLVSAAWICSYTGILMVLLFWRAQYLKEDGSVVALAAQY